MSSYYELKKHPIKYLFWGIIGTVCWILGIIPVLLWWGLAKVGKSFYDEVVNTKA